MSYARKAAKRRSAQRRNHPAKGATIKVEPIRNRQDIEAIKALLRGNPRNLCLFTLGINTAYRAGEILSMRIGDVAHLRVGDSVEIKQLKNNRYRRASLNGATYRALQDWLAVHPHRFSPHAPLFYSQKGGALSVPSVSQMVKGWCKAIRLEGNYGSHSLRKTWGYHQRLERGTSVALLMRAFGHASEAQTLEYLCIQPEELHALYLEMEL